MGVEGAGMRVGSRKKYLIAGFPCIMLNVNS